MRSKSVRSKLAFWNVSVLAIALLLLGIGISYGARASLLASVDKDLRTRGERLADRVISSVRDRPAGRSEQPIQITGVEKGTPKLVVPWQRDPIGTFSRGGGVYDVLPMPNQPPQANDPSRSPFRFRILRPETGRTRDGDTLLDVADFNKGKAGVTSLKEITIDGEPARLLTIPVLFDGKVIRVIQYPTPLAGTYSALAGITMTLLLVMPAILILATIGAWILMNKALQPVREMTDAAGAIGAENLDGRLTVTGNDEFSRLALTFNGMLERLQGAFTRMEHAVAQQRRFTADASHELRTPLTVIKANAGLALKGKRSTEDYQRSITAMNAAADSMNRLVNDLLLLARSDDGRLEIQHDPICLKPLLKEAVASVARPGVAEITLNLQDENLEIAGDGHGIIRVFVNLLENAARYTPETGLIALEAVREGDEAVITVRDTGVGIAPEHLPHITDRFYRVDEARARSEGGSGLGLSICRSIVEAHGGSLAITSVPEHGTTVTVRLPVVDAAYAS